MRQKIYHRWKCRTFQVNYFLNTLSCVILCTLVSGILNELNVEDSSSDKNNKLKMINFLQSNTTAYPEHLQIRILSSGHNSKVINLEHKLNIDNYELYDYPNDATSGYRGIFHRQTER